MTDKDLKKHLRKLAIAFLLIILLVIVLSVYTLGSTKANLSIYDQSEYSDNVKVLGMNEEELKQYLSIIGNLIREDQPNENVKKLDLATNFIDTMCSAYEVEINESGQKCYDVKVVNQVLKELNAGIVRVEASLESGYSYDVEKNVYSKTKTSEITPYCLKIDAITKKEEKMEIAYQLAFMTDTQMAEYSTGKEIDLKIHQVKVVILKNDNYEFSKYFLYEIGQ